MSDGEVVLEVEDQDREQVEVILDTVNSFAFNQIYQRTLVGSLLK